MHFPAVLPLLRPHLLCAVALLPLSVALARADTLTDWSRTTGDIVTASGLGTPPANRVMALVHTSVFDAVNAITHKYPADPGAPQGVSGASVDAAIAAAHRGTLLKLMPNMAQKIDVAYAAALEKLPAGRARDAGVATGEAASAAVLARRANDKVAPDTYRPHAAPGQYVPTVIPAATGWPQRQPWVLASPSQFRPAPPPALTSERWARDYNEIKSLGAKASTVRTPQQTDIAKFWEATLPPIYHGLVQCVTEMPGRDVTANARLFAVASQAIDDAMIAVFDAKYHYGFWRPVTAIRNGETHGNDATVADRTWAPFIDTPLHPEYPCAHCIVSAAVATVLKAEVGNGPQPEWMTSSSTANNVVRRWKDLDAYMEEVALARIYDGVHYRFSTEAGTQMGKQIGTLAVQRLLAGAN